MDGNDFIKLSDAIDVRFCVCACWSVLLKTYVCAQYFRCCARDAQMHICMRRCFCGARVHHCMHSYSRSCAHARTAQDRKEEVTKVDVPAQAPAQTVQAVQVQTHAQTHMHTVSLSRAHFTYLSHTHSRAHAHRHAHEHAHAHARAHARAHPHPHEHARTRTRAHTNARTPQLITP